MVMAAMAPRPMNPPPMTARTTETGRRHAGLYETHVLGLEGNILGQKNLLGAETPVCSGHHSRSDTCSCIMCVTKSACNRLALGIRPSLD